MLSRVVRIAVKKLGLYFERQIFDFKEAEIKMLVINKIYSRENITWVKCLEAHISYNKACKPINLGAK